MPACKCSLQFQPSPLTPASLVPVVNLTLPSIEGIKPSPLYRLEVRVGNRVPNRSNPPSSINSLCAFRAALTAAEYSARLVQLVCEGPVKGKVVSVQVTTALSKTEVLRLAEVMLGGAAAA